MYYDYIGYILYVGYWYHVGFVYTFFFVWERGVWYLHSKRYPETWVSRQALLSRLLKRYC